MKKNDIVYGVCNGYTNEGMGVVKIDGFPLFVKGILENETADLVITLLKKTFGYAKVLQIHQKSPQRVEPPCIVAKQCGGCQLQHMSYQEQLHFKHQKVQSIMDRIGKLNIAVDEVLPCKDAWHYRNKCQMPVGLQGKHVITGFYRIHSNTIIDTSECLIQNERINEVLSMMKQLLMQYENASVFRHLLIKYAQASDEIMVVWIVKKYPFHEMKAMAKALSTHLPCIKSIIVNLNQRNDNVILGDKEYLLFGNSYISDQLGDLSFRISSKSFYQVNAKQTITLYDTVLAYAQLTGKETVLDLYCGVGTISLFLAKHVKKVIGIEVIPQAVEDANVNAGLNHCTNAEFICADAAAFANHCRNRIASIDVIVVDPPRKGLDHETIKSMLDIAPERIVYVSCDPATLARDLSILTADNAYTIDKITPCDMFPNDYHVESVVRLSKVK